MTTFVNADYTIAFRRGYWSVRPKDSKEWLQFGSFDQAFEWIDSRTTNRVQIVRVAEDPTTSRAFAAYA
jgi:hypothetical protein